MSDSKSNGTTAPRPVSFAVGKVVPVQSADPWEVRYCALADEYRQHLRSLARALGMQGPEPGAVLVARAEEEHKELARLRRGAEAFQAAYRERPKRRRGR